jgi:uncharacterized protein HemY
MAMALAASAAISMRIAGLYAAVMLVGLAPRASLAQLRTIVDELPIARPVPLRPSAASARAEWEDALAGGVVDPETWSAIGQRLYAAGLYRESIAAFEQSLVQRGRHSSEDAQCIAEAYGKLGNVKQAARWRALAGGVMSPSRHQVRKTV